MCETAALTIIKYICICCLCVSIRLMRNIHIVNMYVYIKDIDKMYVTYDRSLRF